ncbi:MAG: hypothetical protein IPK94_07295 [Saprospiraceae bacterium]|nr:hypothetical protein [Saprospiraceae bacterium]
MKNFLQIITGTITNRVTIIPTLFDYCGQTMKTQELIRKLTPMENYRNAPTGINGMTTVAKCRALVYLSVSGFIQSFPEQFSCVRLKYPASL